MNDAIKFAHFTSVLEIVFSINAVFVYFELRPHVEAGWSLLIQRHKETVGRVQAKWIGGDARYSRRYWLLESLGVLSVGLELIAVVMSFCVSVIAVGMLVEAGFDPSKGMARSEFIGFLWFGFSIAPAYLVCSRMLMSLVDRGWKRLEMALTAEQGKDL